jgi:hypothetical protein
MKAKVLYGLALSVLGLASWLIVGLGWGSANFGEAILQTAAFWTVASLMAFAFRRMGASIQIYTGMLILVGLFLPNAGVIATPEFHMPQPFPNVLNTLIFFIPTLALAVAAWLLHSGISRYLEWRKAGAVEAEGSPAQRKPSGRSAAVLLGLSVLIFIKILENLYWLKIWDQTNDSFGPFLLAGPVAAGLVSGLILGITLAERAKPVGLYYAAFSLAALFAVSTFAQRVDFRQLTETRAGQVSQAIESYYARAGHYPEDLQQLVPWDMLSIPEPVIIYGQGWCYQGGGDAYRLGYISRDVWFSPMLIGKIYKTQRKAADPAHLCDAEMAALRISYPDYPWDYAMNAE